MATVLVVHSSTSGLPRSGSRSVCVSPDPDCVPRPSQHMRKIADPLKTPVVTLVHCSKRLAEENDLTIIGRAQGLSC